MTQVQWTRWMAGALCPALLLASGSVWASEHIRCESNQYRYQYCRIDTDNQVRLTHRFSGADCRQGDSWGYDRHGVWVDRGCSAEFEVRRSSSKGDNTALAAVAGVAIIAALVAANSHSDANTQGQGSDDVAPWAVGSFSAWDEREQVNVNLTIVPGGVVNGRAGSNDFRGSLRGNELTAGRSHFRIERSGNGFQAQDMNDANHRVYFRRVGGGY